MNADARNFAAARPDAGQPGVALRRDRETTEAVDQGLLEGAEIPVQIRPEARQVEDRIADELTGAVEGDIAAALDFDEVDPLGAEHVVRLCCAAQRDDRVVL